MVNHSTFFIDRAGIVLIIPTKVSAPLKIPYSIFGMSKQSQEAFQLRRTVSGGAISVFHLGIRVDRCVLK